MVWIVNGISSCYTVGYKLIREIIPLALVRGIKSVNTIHSKNYMGCCQSDFDREQKLNLSNFICFSHQNSFPSSIRTGVRACKQQP
jgi:hypothetical protein